MARGTEADMSTERVADESEELRDTTERLDKARNIEDIGRIQKDDILVCNSTDPGWMPVSDESCSCVSAIDATTWTFETSPGDSSCAERAMRCPQAPASSACT